MSQYLRVNFADKRININDYQKGFSIAIKIKKGIPFSKWNNEEKKILVLCCYSMTNTHFKTFPQEEDFRVGRILKHLFNIRNKIPPLFISKMKSELEDVQIENIERIIISTSIAIIRNTKVRPAYLPPIK